MLKLIANIEAFGEGRYVAFIETIKGMVVEGESVEEVFKELLISLKVKIAFDLGVDISSIQTKEFKSEQELEDFKRINFLDGKAKKEISLNMTY